MEIKTTSKDNATTLSLNGRIDTATAPELEQAINKVIDGGQRKVLLDFAGVTYISSGGLRVLLATAKKLKNPGDKFGICALSPRGPEDPQACRIHPRSFLSTHLAGEALPLVTTSWFLEWQPLPVSGRGNNFSAYPGRSTPYRPTHTSSRRRCHHPDRSWRPCRTGRTAHAGGDGVPPQRSARFSSF